LNISQIRCLESKRAIAFSLLDVSFPKTNKLAEDLIEKARVLDPTDKETKYISWVSKGKPLNDPFVFEVINKHDYNFILALLDIGGGLVLEGHLVQARKYFEKVKSINPACALAYCGLGCTYEKDSLKTAEHHFQTSLDLGP
jgi:tetratricopeptide (TPR) repeat protein